jgi:hypothetical protein
LKTKWSLKSAHAFLGCRPSNDSIARFRREKTLRMRSIKIENIACEVDYCIVIFYKKIIGAIGIDSDRARAVFYQNTPAGYSELYYMHSKNRSNK